MRLLRLIHDGINANPQNRHSVLLEDLDLENRERLGVPRQIAQKQPAYVPVVNPFDENQPGYIDLRFSDRILASFQNGKIRKAIENGWIRSVIFDDAVLAAPVVTDFSVSTPFNGVFTIDGQNFDSIEPDITAILIVVNNAIPPIEIQLSESEILAAPYNGTISATQIQFDVPFTSTLGQLLRETQDLGVRVYSDGKLSDQFDKVLVV